MSKKYVSFDQITKSAAVLIQALTSFGIVAAGKGMEDLKKLLDPQKNLCNLKMDKSYTVGMKS